MDAQLAQEIHAQLVARLAELTKEPDAQVDAKLAKETGAQVDA